MVEGSPKEDRMAKVKTNMVVRGISGKLGGLVFQHMPDGTTYVRKSPDFSHRKFSKGQKQHQSRFQLAVAYAREAAKTQPIYAKLAEGTIMSAYNFALSDWFNPPVIHTVERKDGRVRVQASDNVMVVKVVVTVLDAEGKVVEKKEAAQVEKDWWEVELAGDGKVGAEAWDLAGNVGRQVL
jgi:hypothetical protein